MSHAMGVYTIGVVCHNSQCPKARAPIVIHATATCVQPAYDGKMQAASLHASLLPTCFV